MTIKTMMMRRGALALAAALASALPAAAQRQPPPAPLPARPLQFPAFREDCRNCAAASFDSYSAFVQTGERTVMSYLVKPFYDQLTRAFREK